MRPKTRAAETNEFCLVLTSELGAADYASRAIRKRFGVLGDETRRHLAAVVSELVDSSVEQRPGTPITVTVALSADSIRGEVADRSDLVSFEIPLARR